MNQPHEFVVQGAPAGGWQCSNAVQDRPGDRVAAATAAMANKCRCLRVGMGGGRGRLSWAPKGCGPL